MLIVAILSVSLWDGSVSVDVQIIYILSCEECYLQGGDNERSDDHPQQIVLQQLHQHVMAALKPQKKKYDQRVAVGETGTHKQLVDFLCKPDTPRDACEILS